MNIEDIKKMSGRMAYTIAGFAAHHIDGSFGRLRQFKDATIAQIEPTQKTHLMFTLWDAPSEKRSKELIKELQSRFGSGRYPIGIGLFVRPMGDVLPKKDFAYDTAKLQGFLEAAASSSMPVFFNVSGMQWTEVAYKESPLIRMLEVNDDNLMLLKDGNKLIPVKRKLQPPGSILRGLANSDKNGVLYLSPYSPQVRYYRKKNLAQLAEVIIPFADQYPGQYKGISTENETDFPGRWVANGLQADFNKHNPRAFSEHDANELTMDESNIQTVVSLLRRNVEIYSRTGLSRIYTNQSVEDAEKRASPLSTANIPGSDIGITAWGLGNEELYRQASKLAEKSGKSWALVITNPISFNPYANLIELKQALRYKPDFIGLYSWGPEHFLGYGIRGMPLVDAIQHLLK